IKRSRRLHLTSIFTHLIHPFTSSLSLPLITFFFNDPAPTYIYPLSLHDALPIFRIRPGHWLDRIQLNANYTGAGRIYWTEKNTEIEEHTSELQSRFDLVCRLLLEKKKKNNIRHPSE